MGFPQVVLQLRAGGDDQLAARTLVGHGRQRGRSSPPPRPGGRRPGGGPEQVRAFLAHVEASGDRLAALYHLAATTEMRRGELLGLGWSVVDLDAGRLQVVRTLVDVSYSPTFSEPKTARSRRSIALDPATETRLRRHRAAQAEDRLRWGEGYRADLDLVFAQEDGSPINPQSVSLAFVKHVRTAGLPACGSTICATPRDGGALRWSPRQGGLGPPRALVLQRDLGHLLARLAERRAGGGQRRRRPHPRTVTPCQYPGCSRRGEADRRGARLGRR